MKESELKQKLDDVASSLRKSRLISKCIKVVQVHAPNYHVAPSDFHTQVTGNYRGNGIRINYDDGRNEMGGGSLEVYSLDTLVLDANRSQQNKGLLPYVDNFEVRVYRPGKWEDVVKDLSRRKPKKEKQKKVEPEDPVLDPATVKDYRERFRL